MFNGSSSVILSQREIAFLQGLIDASPQPFSRDSLRKLIFATSHAEQLDLAINEFVRRLRRKLPEALSSSIEAVHGHGYRLSL